MKDNNKRNDSEATVKRYLRDKGYEILRPDYMTEPGTPDFKCFDFKTNEKFYVEVKKDKQDLSEIQKITIKKLISEGYMVKLAIVQKYRIDFYKINSDFKRTLLENVDIRHKEYFLIKCSYCDYQYDARTQYPKSCPRCKRRFDYPGKKEE